MSDPYVGEIRIWPGPRIPANWALCDGTTLPISGNQLLYAVIGTIYGGNGTSDFALPDLRGRLPVSFGAVGAPGVEHAYTLGQPFGSETAAVTSTQMPPHTHTFNATTAAATNVAPTPSGSQTLAVMPANDYLYEIIGSASQSDANLSSATIGNTGGNAAHPNVMPVTALNYIICLYGIFPTPN